MSHNLNAARVLALVTGLLHDAVGVECDCGNAAVPGAVYPQHDNPARVATLEELAMLKRGCPWMVARVLVAATATSFAPPVAAITFGMADTFQSGATGGWGAGAASTNPPAVVGSGGPAGAGDGYLLITATGGAGAGSRLAAIAGAPWTGNYLAAGVDAVALDLHNFGSTALQLRLWMMGPVGATALSSSAVMLPAGSGWTPARFALDASALTGSVQTTLADVQQLRLFHSSTAAFPGEVIVAALGVDNISAVPEAPAAWLMVPGLLAIGALRARRPAV